MQTKLTLRLDDGLVKAAKEHARQQGQSVSQLVANFFALLGRQGGEKEAGGEGEETPPVISELYGSLAGVDLDESDYRRHLEDKHL